MSAEAKSGIPKVADVSQAAGVQDAQEDEIVPTRFEKFVVQNACCACCIFFWVPFVFALICGAMFRNDIVKLQTRDQWRVLGEPVVMQYHSFLQARSESSPSNVGQGKVLERSKVQTHFILIYEVEDGNIMTEENLRKVRRVEEAITGMPEWRKHCLLAYGNTSSESQCASPNSPLRLASRGAGLQEGQIDEGFGPCSGTPAWEAVAQACDSPALGNGRAPCTSRVYDPLAAPFALDADHAAHVRCLCCALKPGEEGCSALATYCLNTDSVAGTHACVPSPKARNEEQAKLTFGSDLSCADGSTRRARSFYQIGYPLPGYDSIDDKDDNELMFDELDKWAESLWTELSSRIAEVTDDSFKVYVGGAPLDSKFLMSILQSDLFFALGSLFMVFLWMWFGTTSAFLATCGMTEIVLSIPLAIFMWGVLGMKFLSFFTLCILFLILGIGADDIFVLYDAYQQADRFFEGKPDVTREQKFAYALRRARCAMTVTSATTFCSMLTIGITPIPSVSSFGIFGAFVIAFDYFMVITFFASAMIIWEDKFQRCGGPCAMLSSWFGKRCGGSVEQDARGMRAPERFLHDRLVPFVARFKVPVLLLWLAILITAGSVAGAKLRLTRESPKFFNNEHGKRWLELMLGDGFASHSEWIKQPVRVVLGIDKDQALDRSRTNPRDIDDLGDPRYLGLEALNAPAGQLALWSMCEAGRSGAMRRIDKDHGCTSAATELQSMGLPGPGVRVEKGACETGVVCFIDWVRDYRMGLGHTEGNWHAAESLEATLNSKAFAPGASDAEAGFPCGLCCKTHGWYICKVYMVRSHYGMQDVNEWFDMSKFYLSAGKLQWAYVSMNSTLPFEALPLEEVQEHHDDWSEFVDTHVGSLGAFHTSSHWPFMILQDTLLKSIGISIGTCLLLVWIILCLATGNWRIATLSLLCILAILTVFAGCMPIYGFTLGVFECIGLIMVVGLSVDYTVHISHSYNEHRPSKADGSTSRLQERINRTRLALTDMGISVISGATTTMLAAVFLIPCKYMFYHVFGIFMFTTVITSLLVALTLLPALLICFGPTGNAGDLPFVRKAFCCAKANI